MTQFIEQYRDLGYFTGSKLFNFIALLGWSPEGEDEIFSKEEFIKILMNNVFSKSPKQCLIDKISLSYKPIYETKDTETVFELALPHLIKANFPENPSEEDKEWGRKLIGLYQKEMSYAGEIVPLSIKCCYALN